VKKPHRWALTNFHLAVCDDRPCLFASPEMLPTFIKFNADSRSDSSNKLQPDEVAIEKGPGAGAVSVVEETRTVVSDESASVVSSISDLEVTNAFKVHSWDKKSGYSDYIQSGLNWLNKGHEQVVMLFESPSSSNHESMFYNSQVYKFHDYPPSSNAYRTTLGPCRYSSMNGSAFPSYLEAGDAPAGLVEHWEATIPGFQRPTFVSEIPDSAKIFAYLPCESIKNHVNDPSVHYHLVGKDALHLMTKRTTKMLPNTRDVRPCVVKTTHSMASKGIFIIRNDEDEAEFEQFMAESGNPTYVITEFVEIERNAACHFFIHPNGEVTFFGCNENRRDQNGNFTLDSYLIVKDQTHLREIQLPFVKDVAQYCHSLGFWGFCGADVLFDPSGQGYLVDVNPRVTGSCPSLMILQLLKEKYDFDYGLFRRHGNITYYGTAAQLFAEVERHNTQHAGVSMIVLFGVHEDGPEDTKMNIGVYGHSLESCETILNAIARPSR